MTSYDIAEEGMKKMMVAKIQNRTLHGAINYISTLCHAVIYHPHLLFSLPPAVDLHAHSQAVFLSLNMKFRSN